MSGPHFEKRECDRAPQNCSRSAFRCTPQQFAWLIAGTFENNTFLKESCQAFKYFTRYIIGLERSLYGVICLTNKGWAKAWHSSTGIL